MNIRMVFEASKAYLVDDEGNRVVFWESVMPITHREQESLRVYVDSLPSLTEYFREKLRPAESR